MDYNILVDCPHIWYEIPVPKRIGQYCVEFTSVRDYNEFRFEVKASGELGTDLVHWSSSLLATGQDINMEMDINMETDDEYHPTVSDLS